MRLYYILDDLLKKKDYCSVNDFIDKYNVSKRTIQNDISYLMQVSENNGFTIHNKRGFGYLLEITNQESFDKFFNSLDTNEIIDVKNRANIILGYIVTHNGFITIKSIANYFSVSSTFVKNAMDTVEFLASQFGLQLERKTHYGIRVCCKNQNLCEYLFYEYTHDNEYIHKIMSENVQNIKIVENQLISQLNKENFKINYNELIYVIEYLEVIIYVAMLRNSESDGYIFHDGDAVCRIASYIVSFVEKQYQVHLNSELISCFITVLTRNIRKKSTNGISLIHLNEDVDSFLEDIDCKYNTQFNKDNDFKKMLIVHITLLIDRLRNKISYKNSLANELSITYPMIFNIAIQFCNMLHNNYGVEATFDEIGFIAMHFAGHMEKEKQEKLLSFNKIGVVCSSGGGSAYMIKLQIESLFMHAQVETFSYLQQEQLKAFEPDLVFTVMPLDFDMNVPLIYIKELLDDKDLYRIKQILQCEDYDEYAFIQDEPLYCSCFLKEYFQIISGNNYLDIISNMAMELEKSGYVKKGYKDLVLEREAYVSTVYMNGVCIPHPMEMVANKNVVSVGILKEPFVYNGKDVKIIFMVALCKNQLDLYKDVTKVLYKLMKNTHALKTILEAKTFEEMIFNIKEI